MKTKPLDPLEQIASDLFTRAFVAVVGKAIDKAEPIEKETVENIAKIAVSAAKTFYEEIRPHVKEND